MNIQLQVVGIFYNVMLTIPDTGQTVKDVMDAARANPGGNSGSINGAAAFNYSTHLDTPTSTATMSAIAAKYASPFQSRVERNHYPAGLYALAESFDPNIPKDQYTVWQYYLFDKNGVFMPGSQAAESFVSRSVDNVSRVTWRLVTILGGPTSTEAELKTLSGRNPAVRVAPGA
ncbi:MULTISPECIES: hypothetical protein [unclassified Yoonia]|uniref:hypothetical protein n=1 Tax=unclassified Yoonia TaxID=2629118 RepID=UPI002AFE2FB4|nr:MULTISPECIES: hypothetical protein [unclassified Yoonia]